MNKLFVNFNFKISKIDGHNFLKILLVFESDEKIQKFYFLFQ